MSEVKRFSRLLKIGTTALLVIDIQEKILPVIHNHQKILENTVKLIKGFKILGLPVYYTEQYPIGLGSTVSIIKDELVDIASVEKMSFSCSGAGSLFDVFKFNKISQIAVAGIESHVCVQQTVLDLLENDFQVNVAADSVSSRKELDHQTAIERMKVNGAEITTSESILFELLNVCGTDIFKKISNLIK